MLTEKIGVMKNSGKGLEECGLVPAFTPRWAQCGVILEAAVQRRPCTQFQKPTLGSDLLEKNPLGCRGRGRFSVSGVSDTVGQSLCLVLSFSISPSPPLLQSSEVYLLLTHLMSSQHVLCHRTHGTTQQGSDSCPTASSHCTGTREQRKSRPRWLWTTGVAQRTCICFSAQKHLQITHQTAFSRVYISSQASQ